MCPNVSISLIICLDGSESMSCQASSGRRLNHSERYSKATTKISEMCNMLFSKIKNHLPP